MKAFIVEIFLISMLWAVPMSVAHAEAVQISAIPKTSLNDLIKEALANNPRLKASKYRFEAAQARVGLFRNIPDPMIEYEYDRIIPSSSSMTSGGKVRPMKSLSVSQEIPFPTKLFTRKRSAQKEEKALEQEYKEKERTLIKEVKEVYFKLFLNRRKVILIKDSLSLMGQFVEVTNKKYAANKIGQVDVLRARIEYSKLSNTVVLYEKEAEIAEDLLVSLLGREDKVFIDIADVDPINDLDLKEEDMVILAKRNRPELKSVREMLGKAEAESSLSKQELLPDITLKYKRDAKDGRLSGLDQGEWSGSVGINVPLWFWGNQMPQIREARANLEAAKADYKSAENVAVFETRSAFAKYEATRNLVVAYETGILSQATSAVATAQKAYASGSLSFLELLDTVRMLRGLQIEYFESAAELQISLADLERSVGGDF